MWVESSQYIYPALRASVKGSGVVGDRIPITIPARTTPQTQVQCTERDFLVVAFVHQGLFAQ